MSALRYAGPGTLATALITVVTAAGAGEPAVASRADEGQHRPNVVVLMSDDQTAASQSVMTRTNAFIGDRGATFANSFTNWPLCCPSRATLLTGQYAHNHQVLGNVAPLGGFGRLDGSETLPVWLQRAGYYTAEVGKYLNGYENSEAGIPPGWSEWHATKRSYTYYGEELLEDGRVVAYGSPDEDPDNPAQPQTYSTDVFTEKAVQVIDERAPSDQPLFLYVGYLAPHSGGPDAPAGQPRTRCEDNAKPASRHAGIFLTERLPGSPSFNEADVSDKPAGIAGRAPLRRSQITTVTRRYRCRLESLLAVDEGVGRIVQALRARGELHDTLLIYTSDNGFFTGEHRVLTGKNRVYEEAIRVPLQVRGPGVPKGVRVDDLAINADLAPTILDAAGATPGRPEDGRSLLPFARHPDRLHGRELMIEQFGSSPDEEGQPGVAYSAVRTTRYKYVENGTGEIELYDLRRDPYELQNQHLNPAYAAAEAALAARLAQLRACSGKACRTKPALRLELPRSTRLHGRWCRSPGHFVARVRGAGAGSVSNLTFRVGTKRAGHDRSKPLRKELLPGLLRRAPKAEVRAIADLVDGRRFSLQRRVRICR